MNDAYEITVLIWILEFFCTQKIKISENNENIEDYASQDHEMLNTMEATTDFW